MKYLYKFDSSSVKSISIGSHDDIDLKVFTPSLRKLAIKGENVGGGGKRFLCDCCFKY